MNICRRGTNDELEEKHMREKRGIVIELQNKLGSGIVVEVMTEQGRTPVTSAVKRSVR